MFSRNNTSSTLTRWVKALIGVGLGFLFFLGISTPALAVEPPSIVTPTNDGLATLVQDSRGNWYAQVTVASAGEYIASWEKNSGVWATPAEAVQGLTDVAQCRQKTISSFLNRYPTQAELYTHFEFNEDGTWQSSELEKAIADDCVSGATWTDSQTLGSFDENGYWVVDIPLAKMGPGTHLVFLMGVSYAGTNSDPTCGRVFEDGSWTGYDCIASYSAPAYYQINIPMPPNDGGVLGGIAVAVGSFFHGSVFSNLPVLDLEKFLPKFAAATAVTVVLAILMSIPTSIVSHATSEGIGLFGRNRFLAWLLTSVRGFWAVILMFIGALIAGFADPTFGIDWMSLRLLLTIFVAFVVMDYGAVFVSWLVTRKHFGSEKPEVSGKPIFLLVIAGTVLFARITELDPAMVFGAVIALDLGGKLAKNVEALASLVATVYVLAVGMLAWYLYGLVVAFSPGMVAPVTMNPAEIINLQGWLDFGQVTLGEWLSVFTVTAISTIPISLLPFEGFGGKTIFEWKRWVWIAIYAVGLGLYLTVFFPTDAAWDTSDKPLVAWVAIFIAYMLVGFVMVMIVRRLKRKLEGKELSVPTPFEQASPRRVVKQKPVKVASEPSPYGELPPEILEDIAAEAASQEIDGGDHLSRRDRRK